MTQGSWGMDNRYLVLGRAKEHNTDDLGSWGRDKSWLMGANEETMDASGELGKRQIMTQGSWKREN